MTAPHFRRFVECGQRLGRLLHAQEDFAHLLIESDWVNHDLLNLLGIEQRRIGLGHCIEHDLVTLRSLLAVPSKSIEQAEIPLDLEIRDRFRVEALGGQRFDEHIDTTVDLRPGQQPGQLANEREPLSRVLRCLERHFLGFRDLLIIDWTTDQQTDQHLIAAHKSRIGFHCLPKAILGNLQFRLVGLRIREMQLTGQLPADRLAALLVLRVLGLDGVVWDGCLVTNLELELLQGIRSVRNFLLVLFLSSGLNSSRGRWRD